MSDSGLITISKESVQDEGEALAKMAKELAARQDRFGKLVDYLRAIGKEDWIPADAGSALGAAVQPPRKGGPIPAEAGTWTSEMLKALKAYPEGMTLIDLLAKLRSGSFAERANKNPNGIYNAATKLERSGDIVKYKGRVFLPSHHEEFRERVRKGEVEDYEGSGEKTVADLLVEFINSNPQGVEAGDIVEHMTRNKIIQSAGSVYNNLSKIVARGRVGKSGKLYLPKNSEAPSAGAEGAFDFTGGEGDASPSNMGSGNE